LVNLQRVPLFLLTASSIVPLHLERAAEGWVCAFETKNVVRCTLSVVRKFKNQKTLYVVGCTEVQKTTNL
jgi:hypothetical protein